MLTMRFDCLMCLALPFCCLIGLALPDTCSCLLLPNITLLLVLIFLRKNGMRLGFFL